MAPRSEQKLSGNERLLIELNLSVKYLTEAFDKFQKASNDAYARVEAAKLDRKEFDAARIEDSKLHANFEARITALEKALSEVQEGFSTLAGQIRLAGWIIGIGMIILGIVAPVLTAIFIH